MLAIFDDENRPVHGVVEFAELYRACEACDYLTASEDLQAVKAPDPRDGYQTLGWLCPQCVEKSGGESLDYPLSEVLNGLTK